MGKKKKLKAALLKRMQGVTKPKLNPSQTGHWQIKHWSGTEGTVLASRLCRSVPPFGSASSWDNAFTLGIWKQKESELTGGSPQKFNENIRSFENMTYQEKLIIRII